MYIPSLVGLSPTIIFRIQAVQRKLNINTYVLYTTFQIYSFFLLQAILDKAAAYIHWYNFDGGDLSRVQSQKHIHAYNLVKHQSN